MLCINLFLYNLVFLGELLGVKNHLLDFLFAETAFLVSDGDVFLFAGSFLNTTDGQDGVFVDLKSNFNLGDTSLGGRDT